MDHSINSHWLSCKTWFQTGSGGKIRKQRDSEIANRPIIPLGICWVQQFISRHPQLRTVISHSIEASRIRDVTRDMIVKFFDAFEACLEEYQITLENVYNMY